MDFWRAILTIAATFIGLIIAGYSIFMARAEKAASDPVFRQYSFKECASANSFFFMLFTLMMFTAPFLLASLNLVSLTRSIQISYTNLLSSVTMIVIFLIALSILGQIWYLLRILNYNWQLYEQKGRRRKYFLLFLLVVLVVFDLIFTSVLLNNMAHILLMLDSSNSLGLWLKSKLYGDLFPPEAGAILSLGIGIVLTFFHLYIFQPERLLFKKDDTTNSCLERIKCQIEAECTSLEKIKEWITFTITRTEAKLTAQENAQTRKLKEIFERMRNYADKDLQEQILKKKEDHTGSLKFCIKQKFITYDGITWIMNDINLYTEGLSRFDSGLKEIPEQLYLLTELLKVTAVTNEQTKSQAITSVADNRFGNRSKIMRFLKSLIGW